jgi:hypothetical protein
MLECKRDAKMVTPPVALGLSTLFYPGRIILYIDEVPIVQLCRSC